LYSYGLCVCHVFLIPIFRVAALLNIISQNFFFETQFGGPLQDGNISVPGHSSVWSPVPGKRITWTEVSNPFSIFLNLSFFIFILSFVKKPEKFPAGPELSCKVVTLLHTLPYDKYLMLSLIMRIIDAKYFRI
jgi:hypothetical protein